MAKTPKVDEAPLPFFSVIIPTYHRTADLIRTLTELEKQSYQSFEVVVCSAGDKDTFEKLKSFKTAFPLKNLYQKEASRPSQRNSACRAARGHYFVFIDDHFMAHPHLLKNYSGYIHTCPDPVHAIRGGVLYLPQPKPVLDGDIEKCLRYGRNALQNPFQMCVTNNLCLSRYAFEGVGGFDEDFKAYGFEDSELGCRLKASGFRFHYLPKAFGAIFISSSGSSPSHYKKFIELGRAAYLLYLKHKWFGMQAGYNPANVWLARYLQRTGKLENHIAQIIKSGEIESRERFYLMLQGLLEGPQFYPKQKYRPWKRQVLGETV